MREGSWIFFKLRGLTLTGCGVKSLHIAAAEIERGLILTAKSEGCSVT